MRLKKYFALMTVASMLGTVGYMPSPVLAEEPSTETQPEEKNYNVTPGYGGLFTIRWDPVADAQEYYFQYTFKENETKDTETTVEGGGSDGYTDQSVVENSDQPMYAVRGPFEHYGNIYVRVVAVVPNTETTEDTTDTKKVEVFKTKLFADIDAWRAQFKPVINSHSYNPESNKISVAWKKVNGAKKYKVYTKNSADGEFNLLETVENETDAIINYEITKPEASTYLEVAITALDPKVTTDDLEGYKSDPIVYTFSDTNIPTIKEAVKNAENKTIDLKWNYVQGAVNYKVYKKTADNIDAELVDTVEGALNHYTLTNINFNAKYTIEVKAELADGTLSRAGSKTIYPETDRSDYFTLVSNEKQKVTITHPEEVIEGVSKFKVYYLDDNDNQYKELGEILPEELTKDFAMPIDIDHLSYIINAIDESGLEYTIVNNGVNILSDQAKLTAYPDGYVNLTWKDQANSAGYCIYRAVLEGAEENAVLDETTTPYTPVTATLTDTLNYKTDSGIINRGKVFFKITSIDPEDETNETVVQVLSTYIDAEGYRISHAPVVEGSYDKANNTVNLTWNKVEGASGYVVYKETTESNATVNTEQVGEKLDGETTSVVVNDASNGEKELTYKVASLSENNVESIPGRVEIQVDTTPIITDKTYDKEADTLTFTWEKVGSAFVYEVYTKNSIDGEWVKAQSDLIDSNTQSYTFHQPEKKGTIYFAVKALLADSKYSEQSEDSYVIDEARDQWGIEQSAPEKLKLTWSKNNAEGVKQFKVLALNEDTGKYEEKGTFDPQECRYEFDAPVENGKVSILVKAVKEDDSEYEAYRSDVVVDSGFVVEESKLTSTFTDGYIELAWQAPENATEETTYTVKYRELGDVEFKTVEETDNKDLTARFLTPIEQGKLEVLVEANTPEQNLKQYKGDVVITALAKPVFIEQNRVRNKVNLKWDAIDNATGYSIEVIADGDEANKNTLNYNKDETSAEVDLVGTENTTFRLTAKNDAQESEPVEITVDTPALPAEVNVRIFEAVDGKINFEWDNLENNNGYVIYQINEDGTKVEPPLAEVAKDVTTALVDYPVEDGTVRFVIKAKDDQGTISEIIEDDYRTVTIAPLTVPDFTYAFDDNTYTGVYWNGKNIEVNWNSVENATGYKLEIDRDGEKEVIDQIEKDTTSKTVEINKATVIKIKLTASNGVQSSQSEEKTITIPESFNYAIDFATIGKIKVQWSNEVKEGVSKFRVYTKFGDQGKEVLAGELNKDAKGYELEAPKGSGKLSVILKSVDAAGVETERYTDFEENYENNLPDDTSIQVKDRIATVKWASIPNTSYVIYSQDGTNGFVQEATGATSVTSTDFTTNKNEGSLRYFVEATSEDGTCHLSRPMTVNFKHLERPTATIKSAGSGIVHVQWNEIKGAERYELSWSTSPTGAYEDAGYVSSNMKQAIIETIANEEVYIKVKGYASDATSSEESAYVKVNMKNLPATTAMKITRSGNNLNIAWNSIAGATEYGVYYSKDNKNFKELTRTNAKTYKATIKNQENGAYYIAVKGIAPTQKGIYRSQKVDTTKLSAPVVKATRSGTNINLKWNKITNATSYEVYMKTSAKGAWKKMTTVSSSKTNATIKMPKHGVFYVTVKGRTSMKDGNFKEVKIDTTKLPATPVKFKSSNKKLTVAWSKVRGATGYRVYVATKKGAKFTKMKTTTANTTSTTLTFKNRGTVYVRVEPYNSMKDGNFKTYTVQVKK